MYLGKPKHLIIWNEGSIYDSTTYYLSFGHCTKRHKIICQVPSLQAWIWYRVYNHLSINQGHIMQTLYSKKIRLKFCNKRYVLWLFLQQNRNLTSRLLWGKRIWTLLKQKFRSIKKQPSLIISIIYRVPSAFHVAK